MKALPTVCSALSLGISAPPLDPDSAHLSVLTLDTQAPDAVLAPLIRDYNECRALFNDGAPLFHFTFQLSSCVFSLPSAADLSSMETDRRLLAALRGEGVPLSYPTDWEAVEWSFRALWNQPGSLPELRAFLAEAQSLPPSRNAFLTLFCDLCDPLSAGVTLPLLAALRQSVEGHPNLRLNLLCVPELLSGAESRFVPVLNQVLDALHSRGLLRALDHRATNGADFAWMISLPSSLCENRESLRLLYIAAARVLGRLASRADFPAAGLHTLQMSSSAVFGALDQQAASAAASLQFICWALGDLIPAIRSEAGRSSVFRTLSPGTRAGYFRRLFRLLAPGTDIPVRLSAAERSLKALLSEMLAFIQSLPDDLRLSERNSLLWHQAVAACGQYVTLASELDVSRSEAEESGIDQIRPVHRSSMADTEEEKLLRKLSEQEAALEASGKKRAAVLADLGGFRAFQALQDCLEKCLAALNTARRRLSDTAAQPDPDPLDLGLKGRRVRLLEAAVARCRADCSAAWSYPALSALPVHPEKDRNASELFTAPAAEAAARLLTAGDDTEAAARKSLTDLLPALFAGLSLPDAKSLFRELSSRFSAAEAGDPLALFLVSAWQVCYSGLSAQHFHLPDDLPSVPLLPDGWSAEPLLSFDALSAVLPGRTAEQDEGDLRGLLALLLLRPYRRLSSDDAVLRAETLRASEGHALPVLDAWLQGQHASQAYLLSLESPAHESSPLALAVPGRALLPARRSATLPSLIPSYAVWYQPDTNRFRDPVPMLCSGDRAILHSRLTALLDSLRDLPNDTGLAGFLSRFAEDLSSPPARSEDTFLAQRLRAACALADLPAFQTTLRRHHPVYEHFLSSDPVCACLSGDPAFPAAETGDDPEPVYTWKGIPFARESRDVLLGSLGAPEEEYVLSSLNAECRLLSAGSDDYREALCRNLQSLLSRYPDAAERSRSVAWKLLTEAEQPIDEKDTQLEWPWDPASPSVRTILSECLGPDLAVPAARPFTEKLTVFPARNQDIIGDMLLRSQCILPPFVRPDADPDTPIPASDTVLPPLHPDFAAALCASPEGRTLIQGQMLRFVRLESGEVQVILTLEGAFTLRMIRVYSVPELLSLFAQDLPTLAVWPSVPFPQNLWHAYFTYIRLSPGFRLSARSASAGAEWIFSENEVRSVLTLPEFPVCFALHQGDVPVGTLLNLLPEPETAGTADASVSLDLGASAASVMLTLDGRREPLHGPGVVRLLLSNPSLSADLLRREFLPAVPVSALIPTAVRLFQNVPGQEPVPFRDGILLMSSSLGDVLDLRQESVYTALKWEGEKGRSLRICLHQLMLLAAFEARTEGAVSLCWRFALPDDMPSESRESWIQLVQSLASQVSAESLLPFPDRLPPVAFASESTALGAYFRLVAPEDTRGGFMTLDLGACTADLSLFMRGRDHAERSCQLPLGLQYMLLPSLLRNPDLLLSDFAFMGQEDLLQELQTLSSLFRDAARDPSCLRHARLALDTLAADRLPQLLAAAAQLRSEGRPLQSGALILLHLSFLMMLAGLMLLQVSADSNRNDFLPEQMTLFLGGRGAALPDAFSPAVKTSLWRFLTMFRNRRVASLSLLFSSEKKMELAVGLSVTPDAVAGVPPAAPVPVSIAIRPEELLPEFLLRFLREFPAEAALLFPGVFGAHPMQPFKPFGTSVLSASISAAFANQDTILRPYDALAAWPGTLLDILSEHLPAAEAVPAQPEGGQTPWNPSHP